MLGNVIKQELKTEDFQTIKLFILNELEVVTNVIDATKELKKLFSFLEQYNYNLQESLVDNLIQEIPKFAKMISLVKEKGISIMETFSKIKSNTYFNYDKVDFDSTYMSCSLNSYLDEIKNIPLLSYEEERELLVKIKAGDISARKKLIESNLKLVVSIAKKYMNKGIELIDLINTGNMGLSIAIDKFDMTKKYRFSTYATYWIKSEIIDYISKNSCIIRFPEWIYNDIKKYKTVLLGLKQELGCEPTAKDIAEKMGISIDQVWKLRKITQGILSINYVLNGSGIEMGDFLFSNDLSIEEQFYKKSQKELIDEILDSNILTNRELLVIKLRYGFINGKIYTFQEIADMFKVTFEAIRQTELRAIKKIIDTRKLRDAVMYSENDNEDLKRLQELRRELYKKSFFKTIYEYFHEYSIDDIDLMLSKLSSHDLELIHEKYGEDLMYPERKNRLSEKKARLYKRLLPEMRNILEEISSSKSR